MSLRVYNTLSRTKEPFEPVTPGKVGIYLCGPTVYDKAHIGHMVGPVVFDAVKRYLTYCGYQVTWVVNITDVDDKLINKSSERGMSMAALAEEMTADYLDNLAGMGVDQIDFMPKATESMDKIIALAKALVDKGFAYEADGDVFFDVGKDPGYGKLTNRTVDNLQGEGGEAAAKKRASADFALWKKAKPKEPSWDSPWGKGRPGWHIECSAMSHSILGETFDIHGGGLDLVFPHHENEIAQSECCHGKPMAKYWMHNGLLRREEAGKIGGRGERQQPSAEDSPSLEEIQTATEAKESRSKGKGGLADQIACHGGERIRFFLLRTHYRSTVMFSDDALEETASGLETFYRLFARYERITGESFYSIPMAGSRPSAASREDGQFEPGENDMRQAIHERRERFLAAMDDDFNTGGAIAELFELVRTLNKFVDQKNLDGSDKQNLEHLATLKQSAATLRELAATLGLFLKPVEKVSGQDDQLVGQLLEMMIQIRAHARKNKDFATADQIRDSLEDLGITLEDRPDGTLWSRS